jgi:transposase-like protein
MPDTRAIDTEECTRAAVRLVTEPGDGVAAAARHLGLHARRRGRWKRDGEQTMPGALPGHGRGALEQEAVYRWRAAHRRWRSGTASGVPSPPPVVMARRSRRISGRGRVLWSRPPRSGRGTSRTCGRRQAGDMWRPCGRCLRGQSWGGRCAAASRRLWCRRHGTWHWGGEGPHPEGCTTPIVAVKTPAAPTKSSARRMACAAG